MVHRYKPPPYESIVAFSGRISDRRGTVEHECQRLGLFTFKTACTHSSEGSFGTSK